MSSREKVHVPAHRGIQCWVENFLHSETTLIAMQAPLSLEPSCKSGTVGFWLHCRTSIWWNPQAHFLLEGTQYMMHILRQHMEGCCCNLMCISWLCDMRMLENSLRLTRSGDFSLHKNAGPPTYTKQITQWLYIIHFSMIPCNLSKFQRFQAVATSLCGQIKQWLN